MPESGENSDVPPVAAAAPAAAPAPADDSPVAPDPSPAPASVTTPVSPTPVETKSDDEPIEISIKWIDGTIKFFKVKRTIKLQKIFKKFCEEYRVDRGTVRFLLDGERLDGADGVATLGEAMAPDGLGLRAGDQIDAVAEQIGGIGALGATGQRSRRPALAHA